MNVLFLSELLYPHGGGAELATYLYAKLLSRSGFNVIVLTNRFIKESEVTQGKNLIVYRLPLITLGGSIKYSLLMKFNLLFSGFFKKLVNWADLVYIPGFWHSAIPFIKAYGKPVITHLHNCISACPLGVKYDSTKKRVCHKDGLCSASCIYTFERRKRKILFAFGSTFLNLTVWPFLNRLVELSDAIICVSEAQRILLAEHAPWVRNKARVIRNPIPQLSPINIDEDGFGYLGGLDYLKGFEVLCHALRLLNDRSILVHAANFSRVPNATATALRNMGFILYDRLESSKQSEFYRKIRAVLVPSVIPETSSYVAQEAILRSRIVVASNIGGIPELVEDCKGVFLFEPGNYLHLAEKIDYVSALSREVAYDLGAQNRGIFTKRFSNRETLRNFRGLCYDLV